MYVRRGNAGSEVSWDLRDCWLFAVVAIKLERNCVS